MSHRQAFASAGAAVGEQVADGGDGDVGMVLEAERRAELADAVADDPHADPPVGDRLPGLPRPAGRLHPFRTEDLRIRRLGLRRAEQSLGRDSSQGRDAEILEEDPSRGMIAHGVLLKGPDGTEAAGEPPSHQPQSGRCGGRFPPDSSQGFSLGWVPSAFQAARPRVCL